MNTTTDITSAAVALGRKGGSAKSEAKTAAAKRNAGKGGEARGQYQVRIGGLHGSLRYKKFHHSMEEAMEEGRRINPKVPNSCSVFVDGPGMGSGWPV